jgi:hypothetical protein
MRIAFFILLSAAINTGFFVGGNYLGQQSKLELFELKPNRCIYDRMI